MLDRRSAIEYCLVASTFKPIGKISFIIMSGSNKVLNGLVIQEKRSLDEWTALKQFLSGNLADQSYEKLAELLDLSIGGAKAEVSRMRSRFRTQLRAEVGQTVSAPHEIDEELRYLKEAMIRVWGV